MRISYSNVINGPGGGIHTVKGTAMLVHPMTDHDYSGFANRDGSGSLVVDVELRPVGMLAGVLDPTRSGIVTPWEATVEDIRRVLGKAGLEVAKVQIV